MLDTPLFKTLLKNKLKLLLYVFATPLVLGVGNILFFNTLVKATDATQIIAASVLGAFFLAYIASLFVQAYQDYYSYFPIALYTGKTRGQFLLSSLTTTFITVFLVAIVLTLGVTFLPITVFDPSIQLDAELQSTYCFIKGFSGLLNISLSFINLAMTIHLVALLNYRFGSKTWIFTLLIVIGLVALPRLPFFQPLSAFFQFIPLPARNQGIGIAPIHYVMELVRLVLVMGLIGWISFKLEPIQKEQLI